MMIIGHCIHTKRDYLLKLTLSGTLSILIMNFELTLSSSLHKHNRQKTHIGFVHNYATLAGGQIKFIDDNEQVWIRPEPNNISKGLTFSCLVNGTQVIFDYADYATNFGANDTPTLPYFKFHYQNEYHANIRNMFPVGPMMIGPGDQNMFHLYFNLQQTSRSTLNGTIANKQIARAGALKRRNDVRNMLQQKYHGKLDTCVNKDQFMFWQQSLNSLNVCVPGATNNMLDRGQYELIGLGGCTISPNIPTILPWKQQLVPGTHYIKCQDDYKDLTDIIDTYLSNLKLAEEIGNQAKQLFTQYCTPDAYWKWIQQCVEEFKK